jgi:hypothetical protein
MPYCGLTKAANKLPENARKEFKEAFKATGCMDLYSGYLPHYFQVIKQVLEDRERRLQEVKGTVNQFIEAVDFLKKKR